MLRSNFVKFVYFCFTSGGDNYFFSRRPDINVIEAYFTPVNNLHLPNYVHKGRPYCTTSSVFLSGCCRFCCRQCSCVEYCDFNLVILIVHSRSDVVARILRPPLKLK